MNRIVDDSAKIPTGGRFERVADLHAPCGADVGDFQEHGAAVWNGPKGEREGQRHELVRALTKNRSDSSADLSTAETKHLIKGLERRRGASLAMIDDAGSDQAPSGDGAATTDASAADSTVDDLAVPGTA